MAVIPAMLVTLSEARELLSYDPETGHFTRLVSAGGVAKGSLAGCVMVRGDRTVSINKKRIKEHRLAWLFMTGDWPKEEIDHIDGNPQNNRFSNLREATSAQNKQNRHIARKDNLHGLIGVCKHGASKDGSPVWRARIQVDGKCKHIGLFDSAEKAQSAYLNAKRELHLFNTL